MPQRPEIQAIDANQYIAARVMELNYQMDHVQQNSNRQVAVGRILSMARALRENPPTTLSPEMKDYYLACVIQIADEFLEGR